jgi:hypothetical protein
MSNITVDQRFQEWLETINEIEKVDKSIIAFNFGGGRPCLLVWHLSKLV